MNSNLSAIRQQGFKALNKELGAAGAAVFMRQFENGHGDYTQERELLHEGVSIDDIVESIRRRKEE